MDFGPEHAHIPKDQDGIPVFFILPPEVRAGYDRRMARCKAGWEQTGDPMFVAEAVTHVRCFRQNIPTWLDDNGVYAIALERRTPEQAKRALDRANHFERYMAIRHAKERDGLSWDNAKGHAAKVLEGTSAAAEEDTCWESYKLVKRDLKAGRGGRYIDPKVARHLTSAPVKPFGPAAEKPQASKPADNPSGANSSKTRRVG